MRTQSTPLTSIYNRPPSYHRHHDRVVVISDGHQHVLAASKTGPGAAGNLNTLLSPAAAKNNLRALEVRSDENMKLEPPSHRTHHLTEWSRCQGEGRGR